MAKQSKCVVLKANTNDHVLDIGLQAHPVLKTQDE